MNSCGSWRKLYSAAFSDVEYWTWLNPNSIGLVTDHAVFHWVMEEGLWITNSMLLLLLLLLARLILSVRLSVTFRCFVQTIEDTIVRFSASGRTIVLVSGEVKFIWIFAGC